MRNVQPLSKKDAKKIGGYTLIGRLGSGGMGVVYLASKGSESVALKVVRDSLIEDDAQLSRFKREIETLESINHPNVARIFDSGVDGEQAWFAAEFANGPDLSARVKDKGPLDEDEWWTLAEGLMSALAAVHAAGVIHRDVKPSNVILTEAGPKLIDFGIAHVSDATSVTSTGMVAGSPAWFSPEQIEGFDLTPATDVFSAGSVLTLAATGSSPWGEETTMTKASVFKILTNEPDIEALKGLQREFVGRLLEKEPLDRPPASKAASAAETRDVSALVANSRASGESTRVIKRSPDGKTAPNFRGLAERTSQEIDGKPAMRQFNSKRRRVGAKGVAAVLVPLVAVSGFIVAHQSEARGDTRVVVRTTDDNPIVGGGSLSLSTESQNPRTLEILEAETIREVVRWSSWEELRVTYEPPFSESEALQVVLNPSELGLSGFNHGDNLRLLVSLQEDVTVLELSNPSSDSVLRTWRLIRGNEEESISACESEVSRVLARDLGPFKGLYSEYLNAKTVARLDGERFLSYSVWASRVNTLTGLLAQDQADAKASAGAVSEEAAGDVAKVLGRHDSLIEAWESLRQSALTGVGRGDNSAVGWDESWDRIYSAEVSLQLEARTLGNSTANTVCRVRIS